MRVPLVQKIYDLCGQGSTHDIKTRGYANYPEVDGLVSDTVWGRFWGANMPSGDIVQTMIRIVGR